VATIDKDLVDWRSEVLIGRIPASRFGKAVVHPDHALSASEDRAAGNRGCESAETALIEFLGAPSRNLAHPLS
jgi:hypothetical protein